MEKLGYTIEEAAEALSVGRTVMFRLLREGSVKGVRIGRRHIITADSLKAYLNDLIKAQYGITEGE